MIQTLVEIAERQRTTDQTIDETAGNPQSLEGGDGEMGGTVR